MGTDIHACIEYRRRKGSERVDERWLSWGSDNVRIGRDYELFGALSGQRKRREFQELIPARGIPDDLGSVAFHKHHTRIRDHEDCPPGQRELEIVRRWQLRPDQVVVERDGTEYVKHVEESSVCHGYSYLTLEEIHQCLAHVRVELDETDFGFQVVVATMEKLNEGYKTRLVFWYDF